MSNLLRLIVVILLATLAILLFGFIIGKLVNLIFPFTTSVVGSEYNLFPYGTEQLNLMYLLFPIYFLPFFVIFYVVLLFVKSKPYPPSWALMLFMILLYFIYGILIYGKQFWHINQLTNSNKNIYTWLASEHKDLHFSLASLFGTILYLYLVLKIVHPEKNGMVRHRT